MANKRRPVSFPELDATPKGKGAILRSAEEVEAEQQMLENQQASNLEIQHVSMPESRNSNVPDVPQVGNRAGYSKATYRLSPEALEAIDDAKRVLRRRYQAKVTLEEIAEEAILAAYRDLLENQDTSLLASQFTGKSKTRRE